MMNCLRCLASVSCCNQLRSHVREETAELTELCFLLLDMTAAKDQNEFDVGEMLDGVVVLVEWPQRPSVEMCLAGRCLCPWYGKPRSSVTSHVMLVDDFVVDAKDCEAFHVDLLACTQDREIKKGLSSPVRGLNAASFGP